MIEGLVCQDWYDCRTGIMLGLILLQDMLDLGGMLVYL